MSNNLENRKYVIGGISILIVLIYLVRLFALQIMSDDYKKNADSNAFLKNYNTPRADLSPTARENFLFTTSRHTISW